MVNAVDRSFRNVGELLDVVVRLVVFKNGDYLVVGFSAVDHAESADWARVYDDVTMKNRAGGEDADIHRVAVSDDVLLARRFGAELGDTITAQGAGDEPVEGRAVV